MNHRTLLRDIKRNTVYVVTSDKFLQGLVTGAIFALIQLTVRNVSLSISGVLAWLTGVSLPVETITLILMIGVVLAALWIDSNTEEFREWVEEKTGEEAADD